MTYLMVYPPGYVCFFTLMHRIKAFEILKLIYCWSEIKFFMVFRFELQTSGNFNIKFHFRLLYF